MCSPISISQRCRSHPRRSAHLVLVPNPVQHPQGDFALEDGRVVEAGIHAMDIFRHRSVSAGAVRWLHARTLPAAAAAASVRSRADACRARSIAGSGAMWARSSGWRRCSSFPGAIPLPLGRPCGASMSKSDDMLAIPVRSGEKYHTPQGFSAIKDGITIARGNRSQRPDRQAALAARARSPAGEGYDFVRRTVRRAPARDGLRRGQVPQYRRMLECRHRHHHAHGRGLHARLPLLRRRHRQSARLAGCRGAAAMWPRASR